MKPEMPAPDDQEFMNLMRRELQDERVPEALWKDTLSKIKASRSGRRKPLASYLKYAAAILLLVGSAALGWHHLEPRLSGSHYQSLALTGSVDSLRADSSLLHRSTDVAALLKEYGAAVPAALINTSGAPMNAMGHLVSFIGARQETVHGVKRAVLYISCCDEPVLIVISRGGDPLVIKPGDAASKPLYVAQKRNDQATFQLISRHEHEAQTLLGKFV